ncbi:hypothetical protein T09_3060 [Trichinella sp. T9]|nr:hypothetical protein T09_3060 [Trichinella sp. T9]
MEHLCFCSNTSFCCPKGDPDYNLTIWKHFVAYFGTPDYIHRDQGCSLELAVTRSSPYHPQGNRLVERLNHTFHVILDIMVDRNLPQQQRPREHRRNTGNS